MPGGNPPGEDDPKIMKFPLILVALVALSCSAVGQSGEKLPTFEGSILKTGTVPNNGTSEVQTVTLTSFSGGTNKASYAGKSATIVLSGTQNNTDISSITDSALESIYTIGSGGVSCSTTGTTNRVITITFTGKNAKKNVTTLQWEVVSGSNTAGVATLTPGVEADGRLTAKGQMAIALSSSNGKPQLFINQGTAPSPDWVPITSQ